MALSVPTKTHKKDFQAAIWAVGLKAQAGADKLSQLSELLIVVAIVINNHLSPIYLRELTNESLAMPVFDVQPLRKLFMIKVTSF